MSEAYGLRGCLVGEALRGLLGGSRGAAIDVASPAGAKLIAAIVVRIADACVDRMGRQSDNLDAQQTEIAMNTVRFLRASMPDIQSYESHITIEPVFGDRFVQFEACASAYRFKPAELLLQKERTETPQRSNKDSFCTGHGTEFQELKQRTESLVFDLKECGFEVWRYKIEGIILDVRTPPLVRVEK